VSLVIVHKRTGSGAGNLAQQFRRFMFPALRQKLGSQVSPQALQSIQLLIE
jgi:hypothetical protein